jgi:hypothetical protein
VVDDEPGQIYDTTREGKSTPAWGLLPRPGTAQVYLYPKALGPKRSAICRWVRNLWKLLECGS